MALTINEQFIFIGGIFIGASIVFFMVYIIDLCYFKKKYKCTWLQAIMAMD